MTPTLFRLVTLQEAKDQLSVLHASDDAEIDRLVIDASQIVMDYIGTDSLAIDGWTDTAGLPLVDADGNPLRVGAAGGLNTAGVFVLDVDSNGDAIDAGVSIIPGPVRKATLLLVARLDDDREGKDGDPISPAVASLLARYRDPPVA